MTERVSYRLKDDGISEDLIKLLVTSVCSQLGHDVMNELAKRGYETVGTDILPESTFAN